MILILILVSGLILYLGIGVAIRNVLDGSTSAFVLLLVLV